MPRERKPTDEVLVVYYNKEDTTLNVIKLNDDLSGSLLNIVKGPEANHIYKNLKGKVK